MKVWLDDERNPMEKHIQEQFGAEPDMVWMQTSMDANSVILQGVVTHISLDHDLGINRYYPQCENNGYRVACLIERLAFENRIPRIQWRIHSQNPVGRQQMLQALNAADRYWTQHETAISA